MTKDLKAECAQERYEIVPQMRVYDQMQQRVMPYTNQSNPQNFSSDVINTDSLGFRHSYAGQERVDTESWFAFPRKLILLGGSVALGWGAPNDGETLSSCIAAETGVASHSLGIMAGNSMVEFIAGAPFYRDADYVVSVTGTNTLYTCISSSRTYFDVYGPLYPFNNSFYESMRNYDVLTLNYLISDHIKPGHFFKSPAQRRAFRGTMWKRFCRRLANRLLGRTFDFSTQREPRSTRDALRFAIDIQCRDIENQFRVSQPAKYLAVLQPFLPALKKTRTVEESRLAEIQKVLLRPDIYHDLYVTFAEHYSEFISGVRDYCGAQGIPHLDLHHYDYQGWIFSDSSHLTTLGNQIVAREIARALEIGRPADPVERALETRGSDNSP